MKTQKTPQPPEALRFLRALHTTTPSLKFAAYLSSLKAPKEYSLDVFIAGIKAFTKIANLTPKERIDFYGSQFAGVHYNNDLVTLWNSGSSETIKTHQLAGICPPDWDNTLEDGHIALVYRGGTPSLALDKLLQGPTVIDCGMFCQLSIWFGIRHMVGDKTFNTLFGNTPLYLTQLVYNAVNNPLKPSMGNPLYPFFRPVKSELNLDIGITHVPNVKTYHLKHPGGGYGGDNCIMIRGAYTVFDPTLKTTTNLKRTDVEQLLLNAFNAPQDSNDRNRVILYEKKQPSAIHSNLGISFGRLIKLSKTSANQTYDKKTWEKLTRSHNELKLKFDFNYFCKWVKAMHSPTRKTNYVPLKEKQSHIPQALTQQIPYENRHNMSFSTFKVETPIQKEMYATSIKFCDDVLNGHACAVILTGKAGIGKTASAVSCAKELASRGKSVMWISEVMVRGWTNKAKSLKELEDCRDEIRLLLKKNPDAVFLDDDNLVGYSGKLLLEEIYTWYVNNPGKGLFITSNESVTFRNCYGLQLDRKYHYPPFPGYTSQQYQNTTVKRGLNGKSIRPAPVFTIAKCSDKKKLEALSKCNAKQSFGVVISHETYEKEKYRFVDVEFIPGFKSLDPIRASLAQKGVLGPAYNALSDEQKKWTKRFPVYETVWIRGIPWDTGRIDYCGIGIRAFEKTNRKLIVVELLQKTDWSGKEIVDDNCLQQLLRVLNYAHDCGGKKVILVNNTSFSHKELLDKIKDDIPEREKERTIARLEALLFSPALATALTQKTVKSSVTTTLESSGLPKLPSLSFLFFSSNLKYFIINHRHKSPEMQREYDKRYGLVLKQ